MQNILNQAQSKLTKLGFSVFLFYLLLAVMNLIGCCYGLIVLIEKIFLNTSTVPWWEVLVFIFANLTLMKIFFRESLDLLKDDKKTIEDDIDYEDVVEDSQSTNVVYLYKNK